MANPTPYVPGFDYSNFEAANPTRPKPGNQLDNDFNNIQTTTNETIAALAQIRRSDGALVNGIVTGDALSPGIADDIINAVDERVLEAVGEAEASAAASAQSATESADSATLASQWAIKTDGPVAGGEFSAKYWSQQSAGQATLASQWASKTDGPVAGGEFSSKYWAQQAATYAGLPLFPTVPATNQGDSIFVPGQGPMAWNGTRYVVTNGMHGQCRFEFVSGTECRLMQREGNGLIINGRQCRISAAGSPITTAATAANGRYFVFAVDDGAGGVNLELASTTGASYSMHTDGVTIKTGDPTRTLVGWVGTTAGNTITDSATNNRFVASWFNRRRRSTSEFISGSTSSTTAVGLGNGRSVFNWAGEEVEVILTGYGVLSTSNFYTLDARRAGVTYVPGVAAGRNGGGPASVANTTSDAPAEGAAVYQMFGSVNSGSVNLGHRLTCLTNI